MTRSWIFDRPETGSDRENERVTDTAIHQHDATPPPPASGEGRTGIGGPSPQSARADLERLFRTYYRPLLRFFRRRGFSPADCEEMAQETFLKIHGGLDDFRGDARVRNWVFVIATNVYRNELRRRGAARRRAPEVPLDEGGDAEADGVDAGRHRAVAQAPSQHRRVAARQQVAAVSSALGHLPPRMRRIFELRMVSDLKYAEIASALEISIQTVKSQIHQARRRLQERCG